MEEQEWRTHARRHAPSRATHTPSGVASPRGANANTRLSNHTIASSNKSIVRKNEPRERGPNPAGATTAQPVAAPSRWKEMRQAVRIKATLDTPDDRRRTGDASARIADLCEEDRDKVAKLVRRIVDVSALHEQSEHEFTRQKTLLESELHELRSHVKRDAREIDALSDKLKDALMKLRDYQERVLVLEESNELEVRHRMETDQTVDLLKLEVDKLRKLVKRQRHEMETNEREQQRTHRDEMDHMTQQLKEAHEQLLKERRERLEEKQKELDERIQRSAGPVPASAVVESTVNKYDPPLSHVVVADPPGGAAGAPTRGTLPLEMSSFLNTSTDDLPDKIKEIMNEWKARMEDALNTTAASIVQAGGPVPVAPRVVSLGIQTDSRYSDGETVAPLREAVSPRRRREHQQQNQQNQKRREHRADFDRLLVAEIGSNSRGSSVDRDTRGPSTHRSISPVSRTTSSPRPRPTAAPSQLDRSVTRALLDDFANASVLVDGDSFEDEIESTVALLDGFHEPPQADHIPERSHSRRAPHQLSLYDSSMLDVVDAIAQSDTSSDRVMRSPSSREQLEQEEEVSPTARVERLLREVRLREEKLARANSQRPMAPTATRNEPSFLRDVELFNQVKDVYEQQLREGRRNASHANDDDHNDDDEFQPYDDQHEDENDSDDEYASDPASDTHASRYLSVQEAIEQDMQALLRQEGLHGRRHR